MDAMFGDAIRGCWLSLVDPQSIEILASIQAILYTELDKGFERSASFARGSEGRIAYRPTSRGASLPLIQHTPKLSHLDPVAGVGVPNSI